MKIQGKAPGGIKINETVRIRSWQSLYDQGEEVELIKIKNNVRPGVVFVIKELGEKRIVLVPARR